jgi:YVTN family beta-propeller protein
MAVVNKNTAYVTSIYSDSVVVIDLTSNSISGYINIRRSSEAIVVSGNKAFIANWVGGKEVMVISTETNAVVDSVEVGVEPESMVLDKNNILWVLCNGGWARENFAELVAINTATNLVEKRIEFPDKQRSPTCLQADGIGETLYYLEGGVRCMKIDESNLPVNPLIEESGRYFYKLAIDPETDDIFLTDAVDYQQRGYLLHYNKEGAFIDEQKAEVIPASMIFKIE